MSRFDPANSAPDDLIDCMIDGVLTPAELRAATDWLDRGPDGWKRCALAFLEAQCWRETFQAFGESPIPRPADKSLAFPTIKPLNKGRRWLRGAGTAAVLAASFALGWATHFAGTRPRAPQNSLALSDSSPIDSTASHGRNRPEIQKADQRVAAARSSVSTVEKPSLPTVNDAVRAVAQLHIGPKGAGANLPILAGPGINEAWLKGQPPPVTEYGQVALARQGYQVDQRRRFIMTTLADGRRIAVPVDQVQIRYTGNSPL